MPQANEIVEAAKASAPVIAEQLNAALAKVGAWVEATESFASEQAPLLVQEILRWEIAINGLWILFGLVLFLALPYTQHSLRRDESLPENRRSLQGALSKEDFVQVRAVLVGLLIPLVGAAVVLANLADFLKPILAPRLYLIEYFRHLVR